MLENATRRVIVEVKQKEDKHTVQITCGQCKHSNVCRTTDGCGVVKYIAERVPVVAPGRIDKKAMMVTVPVSTVKDYEHAKKVAERAVRLRMQNYFKTK